MSGKDFEAIEELEDSGSIAEYGRSFWLSKAIANQLYNRQALDIGSKAVSDSLNALRITSTCLKTCCGDKKTKTMDVLEKVCVKNCILSHYNSFKLARIAMAPKYVYLPDEKSESRLVGTEDSFFPIPPMFLEAVSEDEEDEDVEEEDEQEEVMDQEVGNEDEGDEDEEEVVEVLDGDEDQEEDEEDDGYEEYEDDD